MNIQRLFHITILLFIFSFSKASVDTIWICNGNFANLHPSVSGGTPPYFFYWSDGETSLNRDSLPQGSYELMVIDAHYCSIIKKFVIKKDKSPIEIKWGNLSCPNSNDGWIFLSTPPNKWVQTWYINGLEKGPLDDLLDGIYQLCIIDSRNCKLEETVEIKQPIEFSFDSIKIQQPQCDGLNTGSIEIWSNRATSYLWYDLRRGNKIEKLGDGTYKVEIIYDFVCIYQHEFQLENEYSKCLNIPTAFSPNGDGINDKWVITGLDELHPNSLVRIYNRWGELIFESKGYENPWDGGKLPIDSYHYIIETQDKKTFTGQVTIIK